MVTPKRILLGLGLVALVLGLVAVVQIGPRNVIGMLRYDTRKEGALRVGDPAPDVELVAADGSRVHLRDRLQVQVQAGRPLVLLFGSFT